MAEGALEKPLPQQLSQLARESSLFSPASFHEHMTKKRESNISIVALAQEPAQDQASRKKPKVIYENTYKLEPQKKFQPSKVKAIIDGVLESQLKEEKYDPKASKQMVKTLTEIIKGRVKDLSYERYKVVCMVSIGQLKDQGFRMASRCCWDAKLDTFATGNFKNKSLFAIATVWGVYYE